jgi:peroxiredoxin
LQQIVDLENSEEFAELNISLINLSTDSLEILKLSKEEYGITTPILSDSDSEVSETYGVLRWALPSGEPSHTFVLIDDI